jgi:hypothetical protein
MHRESRKAGSGKDAVFAMSFGVTCRLFSALLYVVGVYVCYSGGFQYLVADSSSKELATNIVNSLATGSAEIAQEETIPESTINGAIFPADIVTKIMMRSQPPKKNDLVRQTEYELSKPMYRLLEPLIREAIIKYPQPRVTPASSS